jgi:hypothetical protein
MNVKQYERMKQDLEEAHGMRTDLPRSEYTMLRLAVEALIELAWNSQRIQERIHSGINVYGRSP